MTSTPKMAERIAVPGTETEQISRALMGWFKQYPDFPPGVRQLEFEYLKDDTPCMALSTIQGAYKIKQYITGGYLAQYQFELIYRAQPQDNNDRLHMDEILNALGDWAVNCNEKPNLGPGRTVRSIACDARSSLYGRYENGDEDHQILMTLKYEVI